MEFGLLTMKGSNVLSGILTKQVRSQYSKRAKEYVQLELRFLYHFTFDDMIDMIMDF